MTGGSDDHGAYLPGGRPPVPPGGPAGGSVTRGLGSSTTPPEQYERLLARAQYRPDRRRRGGRLAVDALRRGNPAAAHR